jgi:bis(5'-nucleosyl)-tetraphosphatase (symmetrical)
MATYVIGDVQGCFAELEALLKQIAFNPISDHLSFVGDIVNRGPQSLETLRFIKNLPNATLVLGNHDLYLLIAGYDILPLPAEATLHDILIAPDKLELLEWLRQQPLVHYDSTTNLYSVHAGIPPQWSAAEAINFSREIQHELTGPHFLSFLTNLYGNTPNEWSPTLQKHDRWRYIVNAFTRMRFCSAAGKLDLENQTAHSSHSGYKPWYEWRNDDVDIAFGHWAALAGQCDKVGYFALDTGCVWGSKLTAMRAEDRQLFSVSCS